MSLEHTVDDSSLENPLDKEIAQENFIVAKIRDLVGRFGKFVGMSQEQADKVESSPLSKEVIKERVGEVKEQVDKTITSEGFISQEFYAELREKILETEKFILLFIETKKQEWELAIMARKRAQVVDQLKEALEKRMHDSQGVVQQDEAIRDLYLLANNLTQKLNAKKVNIVTP